ncbi:hypothetical protein VPNG_06608 [Cytospora leucostoma]|uniref:Uncharacterized protein n=1 Tax=Cytospora leucostoma TaxID=1230097 RepID=A0A423WU06_9PEZI|nr:hypothetical protein VPNG_06608 [Cytospora leucostoma]
MPKSRQHRKHDDSDYEYGRGREQSRPRVLHRRSSYDDRYDRRPQRSRRHGDYDYDSDPYSESDSDYDYVSPPPRRRRTRSEGRRRPRSVSRHNEYDDVERQRRDQAVKSALTAGAVEAFRQRNRPGDWLGERGLHVATAALSAAAIDSAVDKDPRRKGKRNIVKSTIGGLVVDKLAKGISGR